MCSDPGQDIVKNAIKTHKLNRVVVAACSPLMHEVTFRGACEKAGLNRFLFQMGNIREHCAWVHKDKVHRIRDSLRERNFTVWIDEEHMRRDIYDAMWKAIYTSQVVIPCLSVEYEVIISII